MEGEKQLHPFIHLDKIDYSLSEKCNTRVGLGDT